VDRFQLLDVDLGLGGGRGGGGDGAAVTLAEHIDRQGEEGDSEDDPASTIRARAPAVVRSMGWGATGSGACDRRAPQESQWRLKGGSGCRRKGTVRRSAARPPAARAAGRRRLPGARLSPAGFAGGRLLELEGLEDLVEGLVGRSSTILAWVWSAPARVVARRGIVPCMQASAMQVLAQLAWPRMVARGCLRGLLLGVVLVGLLAYWVSVTLRR